MANVIFTLDCGEFTERDIILALAAIWNSKEPTANYSVVLGHIFHSSTHSTFNIEFDNAMVKAGNSARKRAKSDANKKAWEAHDRKAMVVAKNLMYLYHEEFFSTAYCDDKLARQICSKSIIGKKIVNGKFV